MPELWDDLKGTILSTLEGSLQDLLKQSDKNGPFLTKLAEDFAREWLLMKSSTDPVERKKHEDNLEALKVSATIRALNEGITFKKDAKGTFERVVKTLITFAVKAAVPAVI